jgi:dihydroorotate dehydrogenase
VGVLLNTIRAGASLLQPIYSGNTYHTYYSLRHIKKLIPLFTGNHNLI